MAELIGTAFVLALGWAWGGLGGLLLAFLGLAASWLASRLFWPYKPCRKCGATGRNPGSNERRHGDCRRCKGTRRVQRFAPATSTGPSSRSSTGRTADHTVFIRPARVEVTEGGGIGGLVLILAAVVAVAAVVSFVLAHLLLLAICALVLTARTLGTVLFLRRFIVPRSAQSSRPGELDISSTGCCRRGLSRQLPGLPPRCHPPSTCTSTSTECPPGTSPPSSASRAAAPCHPPRRNDDVQKRSPGRTPLLRTGRRQRHRSIRRQAQPRRACEPFEWMGRSRCAYPDNQP